MNRKAANLAALTSIQLANGLLPLLIFPYALSVIGPDLYAKVALAEALSIVLLAVVIYSFDIDGVARIVALVAENDPNQIAQTFSAVLYLRLALFTVSLPLVLIASYWIDHQLLPLTLTWALVPLSYSLQSNWLFQGLEHNIPVAVCTVLSRACAVALVLLIVDGKNDFALVPLLIGSAYLAGATCAVLYIRWRIGIRLVRVRRALLWEMLWSGKEIFAGNICVILYRDINVIILGIVGSSGSGLAAYSIAEKVVKGIQASMRPLNQLFFPQALRIGRSASRPGPAVLRQLLRITWPQLVTLTVLLALLAATYLVFGHAIPQLQRIENLRRTAILVGFMSLATFFGIANFMLGWAGLSVLGARRYLFGSILTTGLLSLISCVILGQLFGESGAALSFVLAEALLLALVVRGYIR